MILIFIVTVSTIVESSTAWRLNIDKYKEEKVIEKIYFYSFMVFML